MIYRFSRPYSIRVYDNPIGSLESKAEATLTELELEADEAIHQKWLGPKSYPDNFEVIDTKGLEFTFYRVGECDE